MKFLYMSKNSLTMETNIVICVIMGLPGAGKSTLAEKLSRKIENSRSDVLLHVIHFSFDKFVSLEDQKKMVAESQNNFEDKSFKEARYNFMENVRGVISSIRLRNVDDKCKLYLEDIDVRKNNKYLLILDDNFYYKSMRYKFYQMASEYGCGFCLVYLECSPELAQERNLSRVNTVPHQVIHMMSERLEPPCSSNVWESESLVIPCQEVDLRLEEIRELILRSYANGVPPAPKDDLRERVEAQQLNLTSLLHQADLVLRALVGDKMKSLKEEGADKIRLKEASKVAIVVRQQILSNLRSRTLVAPSLVFEASGVNNDQLQIFLTKEFEDCIQI